MEHLVSLVLWHSGMDIVACKKSKHKRHSNSTSGHRRMIQGLSRSDQIAGPILHHAIGKVSIIPTR